MNHKHNYYTGCVEASCVSLEPTVLSSMASAPASFGAWTAGRVRHDVPDLLSDDDIDERVERFMTLRPQHEEGSSPSKRKRLHDGEQHRAHSWNDQGSPASRRRALHRGDTTASPARQDDIQSDVVEWLCDNMGWSAVEQEAMLREQEELLTHWNDAKGESAVDDIPLTVLRNCANVSLPDHYFEDNEECLPEHRNEIVEKILQSQNEALNACSQDATHDHRSASQDADLKASSQDSDTTKISSKTRGDVPSHVELYSGKRVRIHDKDRAYAALANGDAAIFRCGECRKALLASKDTKLLYCSECGTLTPTDIKGEVKDSELYDMT